jgi:hypothetical protein
MTTSGDLTEQVTHRLWPSFKRRLEAKFAGEPWVKPMYLFRVMRASEKQLHILASLPPNNMIIHGAVARLRVMRQMLAPSFNLSLIKYPDPYELAEARQQWNRES